MAFSAAAGAQNPFDDAGVPSQHGTFSALPYEHVDPLSGNLIVVVTDLSLPGNADFDLRVTRAYNSKFHTDLEHGDASVEERTPAGVGWRLHFGRVVHADSTQPGITTIETPDGGGQALYQTSAFPEGWITKTFIRYDRATHTAQFPNGLVYTFGHISESGGPRGTVRAVTSITDPFGNSLTFSYGGSVPGSVTQVHQTLGPSQSRDVFFGYDGSGALTSMTYDGRTWIYEHDPAPGVPGHTVLRRVRPPAGLQWEYQYANTGVGPELTTLLAPGGGRIDYTYSTLTRHAATLALPSRVVTQRSISGFKITPGTWAFTYDDGPNMDTTVVSCPCGTTKYRYNGIGLSGNFAAWINGTLAERTVQDGVTVLEREEITYQQSVVLSPNSVQGESGVWTDPAVYMALPQSRTLTRGLQSWTTTSEYHNTDFNDYGQPWRINESGELTRRVDLTFQTGLSRWMVGLVASRSVWVGTESASSSWTFDSATGFPTSQNIQGIQTTYQPTAQGNLASVTNGRGNQTTFTYTWGVESGSNTPLVTVAKSVFPDGSVASETVGTSTTNLTTFYEYDLVGRTRVVRPPNATPITYEYDGINSEFLRVARGTSQSQSNLDGFGRPVDTSNQVGVKTRLDRDACGRVTFTSAPYTSGSGTRGTHTSYDVLGRPVSIRAADGTSVTTVAYNGDDMTITDPASRVTVQTYKGFGSPGERLVSLADAAGQVTSYEYDVMGHMTRVQGPTLAGPTRQWTYNANGLLAQDTQPETGTTQYFYDAAANLTRIVDSLGRETLLTYDANERLVQRNAPATNADMSLEYDVLGRLWRQTIEGVLTTYTFDSSGRIATRTDAIHPGQTFTSQYFYDGSDNLQRIVYPLGRQITYQYDIENRLTNVLNNGTAFATNFMYDDSSRLVSYTTGAAVTHAIGYDSRDRVTNLTAGVPGIPELSLGYSYNSVSHVTGISDARPGMSQSFEYDVLDRLKIANGPWGQIEWIYDAQGNRTKEIRGVTTTDYIYNSNTQRLSNTTGAVNEQFTYNNVGELTGDAQGTYAYSPAGALTSATRPGMTASYLYDANQLRVTRTVNETIHWSVRSASGQVLAEYQTLCGTFQWTKDNVYAGGRLLGAVKNNLAAPLVSFAAPSNAYAEAAGTVGVEIKLTTPNGGPLACPVRASYKASSVSALIGSDLQPAQGEVTFDAGTPSGATRTGTVTLINDQTDEPWQFFEVAFTNVTGGVVGSPATHIVWIEDDDAQPQIRVAALSAPEGSGTAEFNVTLSAASDYTVSVTYQTAPVTATQGGAYADYQGASGLLQFDPGVTTRSIPISIENDSRAEPEESFALHLSGPDNATLESSSVQGAILDNEPPRAPIDLSLPGNFFAFASSYGGYPDYISIGNRHALPVPARITYTRADGSGIVREFDVPANGRMTIKVQDDVSTNEVLGIAVQTRNAQYPLDAEHSVYWGADWQTGRSTEGVTPSPTWYFAEGSVGFFEETIGIFNPTNGPIDVTSTFYGPSGVLTEHVHHIEEGPGLTWYAAREFIGTGDHSTRLIARTPQGAMTPIVVERDMWWQPGGAYVEHNSTPGVPAVQSASYFAEGSTSFATYLAVLNPNPTLQYLDVRYLHEDGQTYATTVPIAGNARATIETPGWIPPGSFGIRVSTYSTASIVAERSMYTGANWTVGHAGVGADAPGDLWVFAEGVTGTFWDTYFLIANPQNAQADVWLKFTKADGGVIWHYVAVPAGSRRSVYVNGVAGMASTAFRTEVVSVGTPARPIVVERATYWPGSGSSSGMSAMSTTTSLFAAESVSDDLSATFAAVTFSPALSPYTGPRSVGKPPAFYHAVVIPEPAGPIERALADEYDAKRLNGAGAHVNSAPTSLGVTAGTWHGAHLTGGKRP